MDNLLSKPLLSLSAKGCKKSWLDSALSMGLENRMPSQQPRVGGWRNELILEWPHKGSVSKLASAHKLVYYIPECLNLPPTLPTMLIHILFFSLKVKLSTEGKEG